MSRISIRKSGFRLPRGLVRMSMVAEEESRRESKLKILRGLRRIRRRRITEILLSGGLLMLVFYFGASDRMPPALVILPYVAGLLLVEFGSRRYRCPRCHHHFYSKARITPLQTKCCRCGLSLDAKEYRGEKATRVREEKNQDREGGS